MQVFLTDPEGIRWYRTGDMAAEGWVDRYIVHGRQDRRVKRRDYCTELGEIEVGLATHPSVRKVAVVAVHAKTVGVRIKACLSVSSDTRPRSSRSCSSALARYLIADVFSVVESLPRPAPDKVGSRALGTEV